MMKRLLVRVSALFLAAAFSVHAGVTVSSSRVIFTEGLGQQSLMLVNTNDWPVMVQTWVDNGDANPAPGSVKAPFVSVPPLFSLAPQRMQGIRLIYNQSPLPKDRESVFWLNLYEIPPGSPARSLQAQSVVLTMNTQMKIFWRPKTLGAPENLPEKVHFRLENLNGKWEIICQNRSPWHVSFAAITLLAASHAYGVEPQPDMMVVPYGEKRYSVAAEAAKTRALPLRVRAELIDDAGNISVSEFPLSGEERGK
ncbi:Gram-negative pili assembly chaperone [Enterobacter sp. FY-07]|uniref:fimbrial biogenesis chaperone n=1 Tax=Kosakonia oryzendophytica TaxID=1005665 RepID=UPI0007772906|nr:molecular chaperone [Kosakonia oryzendophytica]AMO51259.1 Gram-negative pili assembly chaperone [Enterobacter sp. FY-07]TDT51160.1 P pilus assembly chaperone PapD [Enterobacter sp. AG5470]WBT58145.1 molecular chaperone [Kosakonia oryzendophytica]